MQYVIYFQRITAQNLLLLMKSWINELINSLINLLINSLINWPLAIVRLFSPLLFMVHLVTVEIVLPTCRFDSGLHLTDEAERTLDSPRHAAARACPWLSTTLVAGSVRRGRGRDWYSQRRSYGEGWGSSHPMLSEGDRLRSHADDSESWVRAPWLAHEESNDSLISVHKKSNTQCHTHLPRTWVQCSEGLSILRSFRR